MQSCLVSVDHTLSCFTRPFLIAGILRITNYLNYYQIRINSSNEKLTKLVSSKSRISLLSSMKIIYTSKRSSLDNLKTYFLVDPLLQQLPLRNFQHLLAATGWTMVFVLLLQVISMDNSLNAGSRSELVLLGLSGLQLICRLEVALSIFCWIEANCGILHGRSEACIWVLLAVARVLWLRTACGM